jgi:hypothetical protein
MSRAQRSSKRRSKLKRKLMSNGELLAIISSKNQLEKELSEKLSLEPTLLLHKK